MQKPKALFFDVNETLLDLNDLRSSISQALGGRDDLLALWFRMLLHYSLVETASGQFRPFGQIGAACLQMVAKNIGLELSSEQAMEAIKPILSLNPHPDVQSGLKRLKAAGYRMFTLTNSSFEGVRTQMANAGLTHYFEECLSVEAIQMYKPSTQVYRWAARRIGLKPEDCMMIAAHGWDVAGAMWAGMRAAFIARPGQQLYPHAPKTELETKNLSELVDKLITIPQ
ncbi:MAG: haloacid dehalogenase type II [Bacteroidia bacterium]|nr:haloacid dehalogenase type II [Bacteroidia bacterium]